MNIPQILGQVVGVTTGLINGVNEAGKPDSMEGGIIKVIDAAGQLVEHAASPSLQLIHVPEGAQNLLDAAITMIDGPKSDDPSATAAQDEALKTILAKRLPGLKDQEKWLAVILGVADEVSLALMKDGELNWDDWLKIARRAAREAM